MWKVSRSVRVLKKLPGFYHDTRIAYSPQPHLIITVLLQSSLAYNIFSLQYHFTATPFYYNILPPHHLSTATLHRSTEQT